MPTAPKLVGALLFGALGLYLSTLYVPILDQTEGRRPWLWISGAIGLWAGWTLMGRRTGQGYGIAMGIGLTSSIALAFVTIFVMAFLKMGTRAMRGTFDSPMDAIVGLFENTSDYVVLLGVPIIVLTLLVAGVVFGLVTEFVGRRFR